MACMNCEAAGQREGVCDRCQDTGRHELMERGRTRIMSVAAAPVASMEYRPRRRLRSGDEAAFMTKGEAFALQASVAEKLAEMDRRLLAATESIGEIMLEKEAAMLRAITEPTSSSSKVAESEFNVVDFVLGGDGRRPRYRPGIMHTLFGGGAAG